MENESNTTKKLNCLKAKCDKKQCCKEQHCSCLCENELDEYTDPYSDFKRKKSFDHWSYEDSYDSETYDEKDLDNWLDKH